MRLFFLLLISLCVFTPASAAINKQLSQKSIALMKQGNAEAAYRLLLKHHNQSSRKPQDWFLLGMAAKKSNNYSEAERVFKKVIELDPSSKRAKLELADAYMGQSEHEQARSLLLDVKASNPPQKVLQNIDRYLSVIEDAEKNKYGRFRTRASLGWFYDSNVNAGPSIDTIMLFGLPFTLSKDAKETGDHGALFKAEIDHIIPVTYNIDWQTSAQIHWSKYASMHSYDSLFGRLSSGPVIRSGDKTIFSLPVYADIVRYENGENYYSHTMGVSPQVRYAINSSLSFTLGTNFGWKNFHKNEERDTKIYSVSPSVDIKTGAKGSLRFGGTIGRESSGIGTYSNDYYQINASYFYPFSQDLVSTIWATYGENEYDERAAAFSDVRQDERFSVGLDVVHALKIIDADLLASFSFTQVDSNIELYEYDRSKVSVSLRKKF